MTAGIKAICWVAALATVLALVPWRQETLLPAAVLLLPLAGLWLLMHAMRLETAIRLTVGGGLSVAWIAVFLRFTETPLPW